jgi:hypothetical protein
MPSQTRPGRECSSQSRRWAAAHTVRIGAAVSKLPALAAETSGHLRAGSMIAQDPG